MDSAITIPDDGHFKAACAIAKKLRDEGFKALFAGGCVRDMVMGAAPHDYDIVTDAEPGRVEQLFPRTYAVGKKFGVIVVLRNKRAFEVATFRADGAYSDGRHPDSVRFGTEIEDAGRRDFTINALFFDPVAGVVIDHVGGRADIRERILRTVGDPRARFGEDYLRMLRAVRFAARFDFPIEAATWDALAALAPKVVSVSAERVRDELDKMLLGPRQGQALRLLLTSGLLAAVLPEVAAMSGVEQPPEFHPEGDVFNHTALMLDMIEQPDLVLSYAALLHDVGKPPTKGHDGRRIRFDRHDVVGKQLVGAIARRLRFPNDLRDKVASITANHMRFMHVQKMRPARLRRMMAQETFPQELELHRLDCLASHRDISNWEFLVQERDAFEREKHEVTVPLITGNDLITLGYAPGPLFKEILTAVQDLQLEKELATKDDALRFVRERYPL